MSNNPLSSRGLTAGSIIILECQNLGFKFSDQEIFSNLSVNLKTQSSLCVSGINGSGKTTLLKVLAGLLKPTSGRIFCFNEEIWPRKNIVFEHKSVYLAYTPSFYLDLSVLTNLNFYLQCYGVNATLEEQIQSLEIVNLKHKKNHSVRHLSTGQKRRFTFAALLLLKPNIIFADEPTNGLDTEGIKLCINIFNTLMAQENTSIVIATHDETLQKWAQQSIALQNFKSVSISHKPKNKIYELM